MTGHQWGMLKEMHQTTIAIELASEPRFKIGGVQIDPPASQIGVDGAGVRVEPRVMQVLVALCKAKGEALSRDDLIAMCWSGRVVSDDAIHRCVGALRKAAGAFTPPPFAIETLPRVGYRLVEAQQIEDSVSTPAMSIGVNKTIDLKVARVAAAATIVFAAVFGFWKNSNPTRNAHEYVSTSPEQRVSE